MKKEEDKYQSNVKDASVKMDLRTGVIKLKGQQPSTKQNTPKLKEYIKNMIQQMLEEMSTSGDAGGYSSKFFIGKPGQQNKATKSMKWEKAPGMPKNSKMFDYKEIWSGKKSAMNEVVNLIKEELLNESSYYKFKNEVKYRTKNEALHKAIREVKRKLNEVDRLIDYTTRMKQELSENEDGISYWKRSLKAIEEINETSNRISNKIKSIYQ